MGDAYEPFVENVDNLTAMWRALGAGPLLRADVATPAPTASRTWPDRAWFEPTARPDEGDVARFVAAAGSAERALTVPVWRAANADAATSDALHDALVGAGFAHAFAQTVMHADVHEIRRDAVPAPTLAFTDGGGDVARWTDVAARSFGYAIDVAAVERLATHDDAELLLAHRDDEAVGTGLLFRTGDVAGLHMVGVTPTARRAGIAGAIMLQLLDVAERRGLRRATLQASTMGEGLYRKLGFVGSGRIDNLRRPTDAALR